MKEKSNPSCSKIKKLIEDIEAQKKNTVEEFWNEIAKTDTPLVEEIEGDAKNFLVTFVARNDDNDGNCAIYHSAASKYLSENAFDRVYNVTYSEFNGEHAIVCWMHTLADGLIALAKA